MQTKLTLLSRCKLSANCMKHLPLKLACMALVVGVGVCVGCSYVQDASDTVGGLDDIRVIAIGEVAEVDSEQEILALRVLDEMTHAKPGDVMVVDYSGAEIRYGCEVDFKKGSVLAVESFGLPLKNPLRAGRIMCRDCAFEYLIGVEAPPVGEPWEFPVEENSTSNTISQ